MDMKELKLKQKYQKVIEKTKETEDKVLALREKKRKLATDIHDRFHQTDVILKAGN